MSRFYELKPNKVGKLVFGIDLKNVVAEEVKKQIIRDVTEHRLLVFKNQGILPPKRNLEIARWFGEIESTFYKHPKSPDLDIFRVSNDEKEGCTNVGRTGWHIDGSFQYAPFSHSIYHIISAPKRGETCFVPLTELIENLSVEKFKLWDSLWMLSDRRDKTSRPLIYNHPETSKPTLCFHLGMTDGFIQNKDKPSERILSRSETLQVLKDIEHEIEKDDRKLVYEHRWEEGDFIISDNLALGHMASPETQFPVSEVGLRVMHRVTIGGKCPPKK